MTINVKDFGAQGDGVSDDTVCIQNAINSLALTGGSVFFPEGTYSVSTINVPTEGIKLVGSGWTASKIYGRTQGVKIINITGNHCGVDNLHVSFWGYTPEDWASIGIYVKGHTCSLSRFRVYNTSIAVFLDNSSIAMLDNFQIETFSQAGIYIDHWIDVYMTNFLIQASVGSQYGKLSCVYATNGSDAILASNGDILSGRHSLQCEGSSWGMNYSAFTNICFDSSYESCVSLERSRMNAFTNCWFSGGRVGSGFEGMTIGNSTDNDFVNCTFANNGGHGATLKNTNLNTRFSCCRFESNSYSGFAGQWHGLSVWPNASNFTVSNCTFKNGLFAGQQGFGLLVNYGTSNKYIITQNIFQSNTIQGLRDDGQGVNKIVKDNL